MAKWSAVDYIEGLAVDHPACHNHHQLVSRTQHKNRAYNTLHYTVYHQPNHYGYDVNKIVPKDFVPIMHDFNINEGDAIKHVKKVSNACGLFNQKLRPYGTKGFSFDYMSDALIYDIDFTPDYNITNIHVRPALARMNQHLSPHAAAYAAFQLEKPNEDLVLWHNLVAQYLGRSDIIDNPDPENKLSFEKVTSVTTKIIQNYNQDLCFDAGVDFVGRIIKPTHMLRFSDQFTSLNDKQWLAHCCDQWCGTQQKRGYLENKQDSLILPSTSAMKLNDTININALYYFLRTDTNLFDPEITHAAAQNKNHINVWKRHGLLLNL